MLEDAAENVKRYAPPPQRQAIPPLTPPSSSSSLFAKLKIDGKIFLLNDRFADVSVDAWFCR